jgi:DNA (cytosine-5)-methyltransferase 1
LLTFGGGVTSGERRSDAALTAKGGTGRLDFDTETFVAQCHGSNVGPMGTLRVGNGNATGGVPFVAHTLRAAGFDASEDGTGRGTPLVPIAFNHQAAGNQTTLGASTARTGALSTSTTPAVVGAGVRRLTPRECERLMGWPDDHTRWRVAPDGRTVEQADGPRYMQCGNGVVANVAEWIARRLVEAS